jgi:5-methylcytosine-specific restriction endonuclease McrA
MKVRREVPKFNKDGQRAKKDAVQYRCNACGQWSPSTKVAVDHISPVIDVQAGFVDWNQFVDRLFCDASNLQVICDTCHDAKTHIERITRLTKQYTEELDEIERTIKAMPNILIKPAIKSLNKYIAKKKTLGLQNIVERAQRLKDQLK